MTAAVVPSGVITLLSDFGTADPYVGLMKAAALRAFARATIVDVTHAVPAQDIEVGAFFVAACIGRFPRGTVHVAVVDPGVGSARRLLAVEAAGDCWIGPDNGLLDAVLAIDGATPRAIEPARLGLRPGSRTFDGRDLMAPIAGRLAGGGGDAAELGPAIGDPLRLRAAAGDRVLVVDRYGNLITNVAGSRVEPGRSRLRIGGRELRCVETYAEATRGELVALVSSYGTIEVAAVEGSAYDLLRVGRGATIELIDRER